MCYLLSLSGAGGPGGKCWSGQDLSGAQVHSGDFHPDMFLVFCFVFVCLVHLFVYVGKTWCAGSHRYFYFLE